MQRYTLYPKKIHLLVLVLAGCMACCHDDRAQRADGFAMEIITGFLEQEKEFARSLHSNDPIAAALAVDSMQALTRYFYDQAYLFPWPQKDSLYFNRVAILIDRMEEVAHKIYPEALAIALLPQEGYTPAREAVLMQLLHQADSLLEEPLHELKSLRKQTFQGKALQGTSNPHNPNSP